MKIIFLDLDSVLVNLHPLYFKIFGNHDFNQKDFDTAVFEYKIFQIAEPTIEFGDIMDTVGYKRHTHQFAILSSLATSDSNKPRQIEIARQKHVWVKEYIDFDIPIFLVPTKKYKCHFANKFTYLVDDTPSNINQFIENGGKGIIHHIDTLSDTLKFIENI